MKKPRKQQASEAWAAGKERAKKLGRDKTKELLDQSVILDRPIPSQNLPGLTCGNCNACFAETGQPIITCPKCQLVFRYVLITACTSTPWERTRFAKRHTNPDLKFAGVVDVDRRQMKFLTL